MRFYANSAYLKSVSMRQIVLLEENSLGLPNLVRLLKALGRPYRSEIYPEYESVSWGKWGGTQFTIYYDKENDSWSINFHIFTSETSYRKRQEGMTLDVIVSWLNENTDFILENMPK